MAGDDLTVKHTLSLLEEGDKYIKVGKHKDIVLILGNTGSGKTTLTQFIAGDNNKLRSIEIGEDTDEYLIVDDDNKISSSNTTIVSQTIFPDLVVQKETRTAFYDCPGFSDTRNTATDIASAYFIHTIIEHAESVKLLFVVNYHSVKEGVDRRDFVTLLKHAVTFIQNIEKFKDSVALVVTKVDNRYSFKKGVPTLIPDIKEINNIARFMGNAKASMESTLKKPFGKTQFYENAIKLIDIFLTKENENYSRIGLFRRPNEAGLLSQIPLLQDEKHYIEEILQKNLRFAVNDMKNFGYAISAESRNNIVDIVETINKQITANVVSIMRQIEYHYANNVKQTDAIHTNRDNFTKAYDVLLGIVKVTQASLTPAQFLGTVLKNIKTLDIQIPAKILEEFVTLDKHLHFLQTISSRDVKSRSIDWLRPLEETVKSIGHSKDWYNFLIDLYSRLSNYDVQKDKSRYRVTELQENLENLQKGKIKITGESLKDFLNRVYEENVREKRLIPGYDDVKDLEIDESKLKYLNKVLDATFSSVTNASCSNSNELIVRGDFVKMSDVLAYMSRNLCPQKIESLKIFVSNKIFIDTDLVQINTKLLVTIIAPIWEIIDDRRIILDGAPGMVYGNRKARNGVYRDERTPDGNGVDGDDGNDGMAGRTGGSAGSFFGIGDIFINEDRLKVTANGGHGSDGQDGGDGADGARGMDADWNSSLGSDKIKSEGESTLFLFFFNKIYNYKSKSSGVGGKGGNGGHGGAGGYGGNEGEVMIYGLSGKPNVQIEKFKGKNGTYGIGGKGGSGGSAGNYCTAYDEDRYVLFTPVGSGRYNQTCGLKNWSRGPAGSNGFSNHIRAGIKQAEEARKIRDAFYIVNDYKNYLRPYTSNNLNREGLNFYERLSNDDNVNKLYNTLGLINEFQGMENQFYSLNGYIDFLTFYRSLMGRVEEYARSPKFNENSKAYKNVLGYLYAGILSKVCDLKESGRNDMVIHISRYLNLISGNIERFQQLSKNFIVKEYNTQYKEVIDRKITEATYFIDNHIKVKLNETDEQINKEINTLTEEIAQRKAESEVEREVLLKKKRALMEANEFQYLTGIMKHVSTVLQFLTPIIATGVAVVNGVTMIADTFDIADNIDKTNLDPLLDALGNVKRVTDDSLKQINEERVKSEKETTKDTAAIDKEVAQLNEKLNVLKRYEKQIFNEILPMTKIIQDDLNNLQSKLKNMSQVFLQISKWEVQNTLRNVKSHMRQLISQVEARETIVNLYERLNEGIDLLINVYDRIQTYVDQKTFADYIASIQLADSYKINTGSVELQDALTRLQLSIKSNIILDQYEKATAALTQFIFPFAEFYIADFRLAPSIKVDKDLQDLTSNAVQQIQSLQAKLIESEVSIQKHDKYVHHGYFYGDNEYMGPYFVWYNNQYENNIKALLSGREVVLKADVMKSSKKNAVKFNQIGISFKAYDDALQKELDEKLKYFELSMTHLGNSYYRCDGRYYVIHSNPQIIRYSFAKFNQSTPVSNNLVYHKLKNAPSMLSPYAMWKLQLSTSTKMNFTVLEKFGNLTDLQLVGYGQYILPNVDVCNRGLNSYYQESDVSDADDLYERFQRQETKSTNISESRHRRSTVSFDLNDFPFRYTDYESDADSLPITSGASSNHGCIVNRIFHWFGDNLRALKSFNPIDYLNQWFVEGNDENLYFGSHRISDILNDPVESTTFGSSTFDVKGNLMLANFAIRRYVTGKKYDARLFTRNLRHDICDDDGEYAHSIAYSYYCPTKRSKNIESDFTTISEYDEDIFLDNVSPTDSYVDTDIQDYSTLISYQESTGLLT